ncbi:ABC transporter permease [Amycolatopsis alkalitolerans]|uniref:ABC transporter permease n=1 Tax=Amycolatopsis alkalitolerans TaxID=2547244 RepID=A0A5C4MA50_9PSEU|nr:ABC transporter permease [Amycolatopsis alkalitolerans]TNC29089.1 ABC transporter permease [Amycolatopsis alkalitolerans]
MTAALLIAGKDLRQRLRDRSAWVLGLLAPLAVATLMSFAFRGTDTFHADVALVDSDHGALATAFTGFVSGPELRDLLTVRPVASEIEARDQVAAGQVGAAFVIPPGFSAAAHGRAVPPVTVLSSVDSPLAAQVGRSIAESFVAQLNANRLSVATALAAGAPEAGLADRAAALRLPEEVVQRAAGTRAVGGIGYYAPAMGIFFMLFSIGFVARSYFLERQDGMLDRIAAAPVRPGAALMGKALATFVYGAASLGTVVGVTALAFGVDWGPPLPVILVVLAMALVLVCLTALVIALSRNERQADGVAAIVTFSLVLLGGNFIFLGAAPQFLRTLALGTPNGWALRAFTDLAGGAGWTSVVVPVLAILAFCAVVSAITAVLAHRTVTR